MRTATNVPLVLHGGSGVQKEYLLRAIKQGIAKLNIGTTVRQVYESLYKDSVEQAQKSVFDITVQLVTDELEVAGSAAVLSTPDA